MEALKCTRSCDQRWSGCHAGFDGLLAGSQDVGLIPLYVFGGPLWQPMAAVIIAGLIVATAFTLFVLPCVYAILVENLGSINAITLYDTGALVKDENANALPQWLAG